MTALQLADAVANDRAQVLAICRAGLLPEDTADESGLEELLWRATPDPSVRLVARDGASIVGIIAATVSIDASEVGTGYVTLIAVRPDHQRTGLGRSLVRALQSRLETLGVTEIWTGGSQPNYWWPGIDSRYEAALSLFLSEGYTDVDHASNMRVVLSESVISNTLLEDIATRRLTLAEFPDFQSWMSSSWEGAWDREVELVLRREPISCFVAEKDGAYVGFAAYDTNRLGSFGPMGSTPAIRGRGVGAALLRLCLRDYFERGDRDCQISWAGPQTFYRDAVAAEPDREFARLRKVSLR
jgi:mycothiol synthase